MEKLKKIFAGIAKYIKSVHTEAKRISWPSKQELKSSTIIVLITLIVVTFYLWLCDNLFYRLFALIPK